MSGRTVVRMKNKKKVMKKYLMFVLAGILVLSFSVGVFAQGICEAPLGYNCWYVATTGSDSNDGPKGKAYFR